MYAAWLNFAAGTGGRGLSYDAEVVADADGVVTEISHAVMPAGTDTAATAPTSAGLKGASAGDESVASVDGGVAPFGIVNGVSVADSFSMGADGVAEGIDA